MRPIDADALRARMYHEAFETDTDMQKWDSGCWIRYKLFENCIDEQPTISPDDVRGVGKWVDKGVRAWSCSCCGTPLNHIRQFSSFEKNELPNYCPNCGARLGNGGTDDS